MGMPIEGYQTEDKRFDNEMHGKVERFKLTKDKVIEYFIEENKVLILDDFHYAPGEVQTKIANQLKDAIRRGFRVIIVSLPHRDGNKPDRQKIKSTIDKMEQIIMEKDNFYKVFECKEDMVYVTEPLFLFFLRWGR